MRPWMIAVAGAAGALLFDFLLVRPLVSTSLTIFGLAGVSLYAMLALVLSAGAFVTGLRRVRLRLREAPSTPDQWVNAFRGTGLERLAGRVLDVVHAEGVVDSQSLLVQSRFHPSRARREVRFAFRDRLWRAQFFTACVLLLGICALSAVQTFLPTSPFSLELPLPITAASLIAIVLVSGTCVLAVESATEPFLDAIARMPTERLDTRLIKSLMTLLEGAINSAALRAVPPGTQYDRAAEHLRVLLEDMVRSLSNSVDRLGDNAELLASTMRALSARGTATVLPGEESVTQQLLIALDELARAIERLPGRQEDIPSDPRVPVVEGHMSQRQTPLDHDLAQEVRELLKEFD